MNPRQNWEAAFQEMHANGDYDSLIADVFEDEEFEEYGSQIGAEDMGEKGDFGDVINNSLTYPEKFLCSLNRFNLEFLL